MNRLASETNVLVLVRGGAEKYVILYDERSEGVNDVSLEFFGRVLLLMCDLFGDEPKTVDQLERIRKALAEAEAAYREKAA